MGLRKDEFFGLTYISGQINGQRFKGQGTGRLNLVEGYSVNDIELEDFPETFSPVMCASWSCKKHKTTGTGLVIQAYKQEITIEYTKGAQGLIYTVGDVRNMDLGASL
jgi:hypothetical protein